MWVELRVVRWVVLTAGYLADSKAEMWAVN
jgi:hypothetical protein